MDIFLQRPLPGRPISWNYYQPVQPAGKIQEKLGLPEVQGELEVTDWNHKENTRFRSITIFFESGFRGKQNQARPEESFYPSENQINASS